MGKKKKVKSKPTPPTHKLTSHERWFPLIFLGLAVAFYLPHLGLFVGKSTLFGTDFLIAYGGAVRVHEYMLKHLHQPLWNPYIMGGYSTFTGGMGYTDPLRYILLPLPVYVRHFYFFFICLFLAGWGMFYLLRYRLKFQLWIAVVAGIAYEFTAFGISQMYGGHWPKLASMAWLTWCFSALLYAFETQKVRHFLLLAGAWAMMMCGHFQFGYYASYLIGFFVIYELIRRARAGKPRESVSLGLKVILALMVVLCVLALRFGPSLIRLETGVRGIERGYEYATSWAMPTSELVDFYNPHFMGILDNYWGTNYFRLHSRYFGVIVLVISLFGIVMGWRRHSYVRFFTGGLIVSTLLALGGHTPLYRIPYHILPMVDKLRGPDMWWIIGAFSVVILFAYGLRLMLEHKRISQRYLVVCAVGAAITLLVFSVAKSPIISGLRAHFSHVLAAAGYSSDQIEAKLSAMERNYPLMVWGYFKSFLLIALVTLFCYLRLNKRLTDVGFASLIAVFILFDLWEVDYRFMKVVPPPHYYYRPDEVVRVLKRDTDYYWVFPYYYEHAEDHYLPYHNIQTLGGTTSNPLIRYQKFIGAHGTVMFRPNDLRRLPHLLDVFNTKYIITFTIPEDISRFDPQTQAFIKRAQSYMSRFDLVYKGRRYSIYRNPYALPRAFFAPRYVVVDSADEALALIKRPDFPYHNTVILEEDPSVPQGDTLVNGYAKILKYDMDHVTLEVVNDKPTFLVLAENWYPDWHARVDGKPTKVYVADGTLRAIYLTAGKHNVEFTCKSKLFYVTGLVTLIGWIIVLAAALTELICRRHTHD